MIRSASRHYNLIPYSVGKPLPQGLCEHATTQRMFNIIAVAQDNEIIVYLGFGILCFSLEVVVKQLPD